MWLLGLPREILGCHVGLCDIIYIYIFLLYIHNVVKHGKTMAKPINHPICQVFGGHPKAGSARHGNPTMMAAPAWPC